jgi:hypothetical protein
MRKTVKNIFRKFSTRSRPDFIIIGAQKAGTSGLFSILEKHSLVSSSSTKEIHYFDNDDWYNNQQIKEYHSHFPYKSDLKAGEKVFEATPLYIFHPEVAKRLHRYNPDLKLILILRNPADRAFSAWTMYHHNFKTGKHADLNTTDSFTKVIADEMKNIESATYFDNPRAYVKRGIYHTQIEEYLKYFNRDQLLIIESSNLKKNHAKTLDKIQSFLGVPHEDLKFISSNPSQKNDKHLYEADLIELRDFYKPYNEKLYELLGERYDW